MGQKPFTSAIPPKLTFCKTPARLRAPSYAPRWITGGIPVGLYLAMPFDPPSEVHSPAVPCSDLTVRNSLKGYLHWVLLSVTGLLCCFDVLYYSADSGIVNPCFCAAFPSAGGAAPVFRGILPSAAPIFVHPGKPSACRIQKKCHNCKISCWTGRKPFPAPLDIWQGI